MPLPYTVYHPHELLSQNQIDILSEIQKVMEARILHNRNLLEFFRDEKNNIEVEALIKNLFFKHENFKGSLKKIKNQFILSTESDLASYMKFLREIEVCKTVHAFDGLYFGFFVHLGSLQYPDNIGDKISDQHLSLAKISADQKKALNNKAKKAAEEADVYELIYYKEFCEMLEPHICKRSKQFKVHHIFKYTFNALAINPTPLGFWLLKMVSSRCETIQGLFITESENFAEDQVSQFFEAYEKIIHLNKLTVKKRIDNFELYKIARQHFDCRVNLLLIAEELLRPPLVMTTALPAVSVQDMLEEKAIAPTIPISSAITLPDSSSLNIDVAFEAEQKRFPTTLIESFPAVVLNIKADRSSKSEEQFSKCASVVVPIEKKMRL